MAKHRANKKERQIFTNRKLQSNLKEVYAVALIALSILLITFTFIKGTGLVGKYMNSFLKYLFGLGRYIFPIFLLFWATNLLVGKKRDHNTFGYGLIIGFISLVTIFHLKIPLQSMMKVKNLIAYGGITGGLFAYTFKYLFGAAGSYIIVIFCLVIGLMLTTEIKLISIWNWLNQTITNSLSNLKSEKPAIKNVNINHLQTEILSKEPDIEKPIKSLDFKEEIIDNEKTIETVELPKPVKGSYILPPLSIFKVAGKSKGSSKKDIRENIALLEKTLHNFDVDAHVSKVVTGPTVTRYEIHLASGVKVNRILSLSDDIALTFASPDVRIIAPIPGKSAIGIEVPNVHRELVTIGEILASDKARSDNHPLTVGLGKDISGNAVLANLGNMPHLLIAGATGSGKSVCINTIIASLLTRATPNQVKLIMIDPKRVELNLFNGIAHLLTPVVTNSKQASHALNWAVSEMDNRFDILSEHKVKNIYSFNKKMEKSGTDKMPFIVLIIDELADLMMVSPREVEDAICRLAQLARAVGIHLIVATQRPSTDVITGLIKANIMTRIAFAVSSQTDSRVILDTGGAEKLVGKGDALYSTAETIKPQRIQSAFLTENEIQSLTDYIRQQAKPEYVEDITKPAQSSVLSQDFDDELFDEAMELIVNTGKASVSYLQRRLRIGYGRAARLMDMLEDKGIVSPQDGSKPREVLIQPEEIKTEKEMIETID